MLLCRVWRINSDGLAFIVAGILNLDLELTCCMDRPFFMIAVFYAFLCIMCLVDAIAGSKTTTLSGQGTPIPRAQPNQD